MFNKNKLSFFSLFALLLWADRGYRRPGIEKIFFFDWQEGELLPDLLSAFEACVLYKMQLVQKSKEKKRSAFDRLSQLLHLPRACTKCRL